MDRDFDYDDDFCDEGGFYEDDLYEEDLCEDEVNLIDLASYYEACSHRRNNDGFCDVEDPDIESYRIHNPAKYREELLYSRLPIRYWEVFDEYVSVCVDGNFVGVHVYLPDDETGSDDLPF